MDPDNNVINIMHITPISIRLYYFDKFKQNRNAIHPNELVGNSFRA